MKNYLIYLVLCILTFQFSHAQTETCDCQSDLTFLVEKIKKMPSYKHQINRAKAVEFEQSYKDLSQLMTAPLPIETCYKLLVQQLYLVHDLHAYITFDQTYFNEEDLTNAQALEKFKQSTPFLSHPRSSKDLNALEATLAQAPLDHVEGVYSFNDLMQIGLYFDAALDTYVGVVLSSTLAHWEPGQIKLYAKKNKTGKYNLYSYHHISYQPSTIRGMTFANGRLWALKKGTDTANAELAPSGISDWEFKQLSDTVQYTYFGNFSSFSSANKKAYRAFYAAHKDDFNTAKHIIVDLRSNRGGNKKISDAFYKLFKKSKARVYVLTNSFTGSNGEQFTVQLKSLKNTLHLGQATRGIIAYGTNYGYTHQTPSGNFTFKPTDMDFHKAFFQYEGTGVTPDQVLAYDQDWITQTLALIANNKQP